MKVEWVIAGGHEESGGPGLLASWITSCGIRELHEALCEDVVLDSGEAAHGVLDWAARIRL